MENSTEIVAISKVIKAAVLKEARAELEPGEYAIDTTVRVHGGITVEPNYQRRVVQKARPWNIVAGLLKMVEATTGAGVDVEKLAELSLADEAVEKSVMEAVDAQIKAIKGETYTECDGRVLTDLTMEINPGA